MSKRHELLRHIKSLKEISEIMSSIKTLSLLELHKIAQALNNQERMVASIEDMIREFASFYPLNFPSTSRGRHCVVVIGSERGFCGGFNDNLIKALEEKTGDSMPQVDGIITVGQKIATPLEDHPLLIAQLGGVSVLEESGQVIQSILTLFKELQESQNYQSMEIVYFEHEQETVRSLSLIPPFRGMDQAEQSNEYPPVLNLRRERFLTQLVDQYLFFRIFEVVYSSAMMENQQRIRHLEVAVERIDEQVEQLDRRGHILRQEEITEEIEVILLSAQSQHNWPQ